MFLAVLIFLFAACWFTAATFAHFLGGPSILIQALTMVVPVAFVAVVFTSRRHQHGALSAAAKVSSLAMGYINFAFLAAIACWPVVGLGSALNLAVAPATLAWSLLGLSALVATYGVINGARVHVTRYTIPLPNLPDAWDGREVAVVSDVHVGIIRGPAFVQRVVRRLQALNPTAVFIPGDLFDGPEVDIAQSVAPLAQLTPPAGTYFVTGNHDEFRDPLPYLAALTRVGVRVLHNESVQVRGLQIIGLHDAESDSPETFRRHLAAFGIDRARPSVLLAHRPSHMEIADAAGVSLQLSGHTHAGQFPVWTWIVNKIYGRFAYGLNRVGDLQIVTSSGVGSGGPPLRVGTRSEIVLLRLECAAAAPVPREAKAA